MRKTFLFISIILLSVLISCNGNVNEKIFENHEHYYEIQADGSYLCTRCNHCLEGTMNSYVTVIENGQPSTIISLENNGEKNVGFGTITVNDNVFTYKNESLNAQQVVIRTNGGHLSVIGKIGTDKLSSDEIFHYGYAAVIDVKVAEYCFYTHAHVGEMNLEAGKAVADKNGYVALLTAKDSTQVEEINGGLFVIPSGTPSEEENTTPTPTKTINNAILSQLGYKEDTGKKTIVIDEETLAGQERQSKINNSTYVISTVNDLVEFRTQYNAGAIVSGRKVILNKDLDISKIDWIPIGTWEYPYQGTFDGQGHTITGMKASDSAIISVGEITLYGEVFGFFGIVGDVDGNTEGDVDVSVSNINFKDVNIAGEEIQNMGVVIGYAPTTSDFNEEGRGGTYAPGKWTGNEDIGKCHIVINNVSVSGNIDVKAHAGGFIGKLYKDASAELTDCTNSTSITTCNKGGLAGFVAYCKSNNLRMIRCANTELSSLTYNGTTEVNIGDFFSGNYDFCVKNVFPETNEDEMRGCSSKISISLPSELTCLVTHFVKETTVENLTVSEISSQGKLIIKDCNVVGKFENRATMTVYNCTAPEAIIFNTVGSKLLTVKSGTYKAVMNKGATETTKDTAVSLIIDGGNFSNATQSINGAYRMMQINGGTFDSRFDIKNNSSTEITGGSFNKLYKSTDVTTYSLVLKGGSYVYNNLLSENVAEGYKLVEGTPYQIVEKVD